MHHNILMNGLQTASLRALSDNFIHVIFNATEVVAVDPGAAQPVLDFIEQKSLRLSHVLITHHHPDHIGGCLELKKRTNCVVIGPDDPRITCLDRRVDENTQIDALSTGISILSTPGHTLSHICFYVNDAHAVFTGDTLFLGGCGRLFEGTPADMWSSLIKLRNLPGDTRVFPGHDYTRDNLLFCRELLPENRLITNRLSSLDQAPSPSSAELTEEIRTNVFLMCDNPAVADAIGLTGDPEHVFSEIRRRKDQW